MRFSLIILTILLLQSSPGFALTPEEGAILQDIQAKQRIESERRDLMRQKEAQEIQNIGRSKKPQEEPIIIDQVLDDKTCRVIRFFEISGNNEIYDWTINHKFIHPLQKQKPDSCFTKADLARLHDQITNYYIKEGFVLARVYFDAHKIIDQKISIIIEEGKLEKLKIKDNSKLNDALPFRRTLQKFSAFPSLWNNSDDVINLRDIEQGLEQINRLGSQSAKMAMHAGNKPGYSNVMIENQIGHQANLSVGMDNSGQATTGRQKRKASLNYDNLLGINDNIYLNYSESNALPLFGSDKQFNDIIGTGDNSNRRFSKAFYGAISVPFGYYTLGATYSNSHYLLTTTGSATTFKSSGNSESKSFYIDKVLARGQKYKTSLKAELMRSDTDSYLEDTYIPINSRRLSEATFYLNNTIYVPMGSLYFQPKYTKGLRGYGGMRDQAGLARDKPHAQFETYGLYAQTNLNFTLPKLKKESTSQPVMINHKLTFDSMKSNASLYGTDQFMIGGKYTVRGFQQNIISGDSGYLIRNDLSMRLFDLAPKSFLDSEIFNLGGKDFSLNSAISKMRFGIFHDYGYVRNLVVEASTDKGYMSGVGAVLNYSGKNLSWDVTYSKGLHSPQFLRTVDHLAKENETIYFSLTFNLGLL